MRIISGQYRGRKLLSPSNQDIRPTSDRMRETMFNILSHAPISLTGANVLDVFAGTGALGLEALSRGAAHVTFFDKHRPSLDLVKRNIALLQAEKKTRIKCVSAPILPRPTAQFNFIFLDPPYNLNVINETIISLKKSGYMAKDCLVIAEYAAANPIEFPDFLKVSTEKTYGEAHFSFLEVIS
ncbi:16S rRNA (guanine(966)-N(2))-methyltransferase RsmD [Paremcibacter congregatus]|uniref:16S rRNA (Guanine(966)-N(2))-methyltransferase RsmD n=1 Tax=Paremcibacter congregatus TaxID=2043170 RepID=A0A2G4YRR4_9PROT|nr:16S rRNA (guanine(966)-N(2))-methyltransferase RsmD [Paremcibacter congregatus]PHZ85003.1 16S rRNA (guanine(966)-N(2))-methyltransferase RsmD [Paremcibacter congregatus]QDE26022.1 16S rRNA (guanine(966)-N(2))-methyltransferase RsmD [Paremcibacter congregatus]